MIIVSQDETSIINFDNIEEIYVSGKFINVNYSLNNNECIAKYKTEERAKEVLQEITMLFKNEEMFHIRKSTLNNLDELAGPKYILKPVSRPKVFEMPEE